MCKVGFVQGKVAKVVDLSGMTAPNDDRGMSHPLSGPQYSPHFTLGPTHRVVQHVPFPYMDPYGGNIVREGHFPKDPTSVYHCFAGEERYLTEEGLKTFAETAGTVQRVLTGKGVWVEAPIRSFGTQQLWALTVQRNKTTRVIYTTEKHRWRVTGHVRDSHTTKVVETADLKANDRLDWLLPRTKIAQSTPSPFGIAHGVVYGDGTRYKQHGTRINLGGEKDEQLLPYFAASRQVPKKTPAGVLGMFITDMPNYFKDRPSLDESTSYLYGWLAGYFAADGNVSRQGQVVLNSAKREDLEFVERIALRLGISTYGIQERERSGYGGVSKCYRMQFIGTSLRENFFLIREHRLRYVECMERGNSERLGWHVVSVEPTDRVEEVFCATVPDTESFVLEGYIHTKNCPFCGSGNLVGGSAGTIECGYCHQSFTVMVEPIFSFMPQTDPLTGEPMPGFAQSQSDAMSATGDEAGEPGGATMGGEPRPGEGGAFGEEGAPPGEEGEGAPPFAKKDEGEFPPKKDKKKEPPPFAKKTTRTAAATEDHCAQCGGSKGELVDVPGATDAGNTVTLHPECTTKFIENERIREHQVNAYCITDDGTALPVEQYIDHLASVHASENPFTTYPYREFQ
jgi:hypothetical protein